MGKHGAGGCSRPQAGRWHRGQCCLCGAMLASGWAERALLCELTLFASTLALFVSVWEWPWFGSGVSYKDRHRAVTCRASTHCLLRFPRYLHQLPLGWTSAATGELGGSSSHLHGQMPDRSGFWLHPGVFGDAGDDGSVRHVRKYVGGVGAGCAPKGRRTTEN